MVSYASQKQTLKQIQFPPEVIFDKFQVYSFTCLSPVDTMVVIF